MKQTPKWKVLGVIAILFPSFFGPLNCAAMAGEVTRIFETAVFEKSEGDTLAFLVDWEKRILAVKGRLTSRTRIVDDRGLSMRPNKLTPGSVWNLTVQYPTLQEGLPVIVELKKIQDTERE